MPWVEADDISVHAIAPRARRTEQPVMLHAGQGHGARPVLLLRRSREHLRPPAVGPAAAAYTTRLPATGRALRRLSRRGLDAGKSPSCRNEGVIRTHIYPRTGIITHGSSTLPAIIVRPFYRSGRESDRRIGMSATRLTRASRSAQINHFGAPGYPINRSNLGRWTSFASAGITRGQRASSSPGRHRRGSPG